MGFADKLKDLTKKAQDTAVEHKDQIHQAVEKAEVMADQRTGGKYHDKIAQAGTKAETYVENLKPTDRAAAPPAPQDPSRPETPSKP
ncbi:MAG: antitoxin [Solirubrobacterales bacterium]|nr:antitoxin [Solirubrobacterales bacterium]